MSHPAPPRPASDFLTEATESLRGAGALLVGRADGMRRFDLTITGFWHSFGAILAILPVFVAYLAAEHAVSDAAGNPDVVPGALRWLGLAVDWVDMPLAMLGLALLLGLGRTYVPFIVAYNWGSVIAYALLCAPMLLLGLELISADLAAFATLVLLGIVMRYRWFIARVALEVGRLTAFGIALFDLVLSLVLIGMIERLIL